ncbi:MAG: hypothetical protein WD939_02730, partial [Dehalococcoidia bacterium]
MAWLIFFAAAAAIFVAGQALARHGTVIAERTGIGHVWVGALLVAGATSLPELTIDSVAVVQNAPNLATGDLFGSNMANMAVLAIVALAFERARVIQREALGIVLAASSAIVLTGLASMFIVARLDHSIAGAFGYGSVALFAAVIASASLLPGYRAAIGDPGPPHEDADRRASLRRSAMVFVGATVVIFATAPLLVNAAEDVAEITGLAETFVGVVMLAVATSLPELAT